ncbi:hypothetical protein PN498_04385 [Oscillatoria sp. CS-180]|uniref:hypothetical protein n=1 Tax=Oscillatoria sp. CS-180 TaxID=3021720 RepID=UPI00232C5A8F|nr:hypothetical protein [Oscillatoria sp. CS-180]MDB9525214.1 hypothetical protein [Oscillatoria sp. CS-180]
MANETRGLLFETVAEAALQQAVQLAGIPGTVRWNEKPAGMSINPDFTIGKDKDSPSHVVLVTASGAEHNSHMKMWRNLAEIFEAKAQLPATATVISIYGLSRQKKNVRSVINEIVDLGFHSDEQIYSEALSQWIEQGAKGTKKAKEEKKSLLTHSSQANLKLAGAVLSLAKDLAQVLQQRNTELDALWQLMREDYTKAHHPPEAKTTSVRRGLGKLLVLEPSIRQLVYAVYNKRSGIRADNLPQYAYELGFFKKSLVGAHVDDPEIKAALDLLGGETCEAVLEQAPASIETWINPLRDLARVATHVDFIYENYDQITDSEGFRELLSRCFNDPSGLSGEPGDEKVWVYEIMVSLLKAETGRLQGYGLAQLAEDTGLVETR